MEISVKSVRRGARTEGGPKGMVRRVDGGNDGDSIMLKLSGVHLRFRPDLKKAATLL